jgi:polysaccharide deacetylase family protein (PEP-CTERM system associated)
VDRPAAEPARSRASVILSFDVEEHHRIEAAAGLCVVPALQAQYRAGLERPTQWLLEQLGAHGIRGTFFIVAQIAGHSPGLIRQIARAGHEIASHGWDHQRVQSFTPASFREDVRRSKDALEQVTGTAVYGYRAPTFSIDRKTAWAIDVLAELGMRYDSSIYPVRHDRYGVPEAPRSPFMVSGIAHRILEIPPATLRVLGTNVPVGGGGYFRLFPLFVMEQAMLHPPGAQQQGVTMLYFHPWEFEPRQPRLPLRPLSRFRTYVGIHRSRARLNALLGRRPHYSFVRAIDVAEALNTKTLASFRLAARP